MSKAYFQAIHQIITAGHRITDGVNRTLKELGATEPQYNVLRILHGAKNKPMTVQEILEHMVQRSSNVTRIVDKLLAKGFVERKECPTNRRKMDITITAAGQAHLRKMDRKVYALHKPMMQNLDLQELDTLTQLIRKLKIKT